MTPRAVHGQIVDTLGACEILGGVSRETFRLFKKRHDLKPVPWHSKRYYAEDIYRLMGAQKPQTDKQRMAEQMRERMHGQH